MAVIVADRTNDTIVGTADGDSITGSVNGADLIDGAGGADTITGGGGFGGDFPRVTDTLRGGDGDDRIIGVLEGLLFGDAGDDTLVGTPDFSAYTMEGGAGDDRIEANPFDHPSFAAYTTAMGGVQVSLAIAGPQAVGGGHGVDTLVGVLGLIGSAHADTLTGSASGRLLVGGAGDDRLVGGENLGNQFDPGAGNDTVVGASGRDVVSFAVFPESGPGPIGGLTIDLRIADPQGIGGGMGVKTLVSIENVAGSTFGDTLTGGSGANYLSGLAGDDSLSGLEGDDSFDGGDGDDTLIGGAGNDTFQTRGGNDRLEGGDGDDRVFAGISSAVAQDQNLHGNRGEDTISATRGADTIRGGQGDDILEGEAGDDWLAGDRGGDVLTGGAGADVFHAWNEAGLDRVTDFNASEGDRVYLLPGAAPTIRQVDADTWIDFGGGNQMVLQGVQLSALPDGWIFGA